MAAYSFAAAVSAVLTYVIAAFAMGWLLSIALAGLAPAWPRFLAQAVISTVAGMIFSRLLTDKLFPFRSDSVVVAGFVFAIAASIAAGWAEHGRLPSWLQAFQSLLLVSLAYALFRTREARRSN